MKPVAVTALALVLLAGCEKKPDAPAPSASSSAASSSSITAKAAPSAVAGPSSEEDFEDEAEAQITEDNFEAELAKMEKEIP